jgi:ferredoxin
MADFFNRYPQNVPGKYYIDHQCTDCDLCRETAPNNIRRNDEGGHSYVFRQPETPEETALCEEGVAGCPTEAVGNDGNQPHDPAPKTASNDKRVPRPLRLVGAGLMCLLALAATVPNLGGFGEIPGYGWPDYLWLAIVFTPFVLVVVGAARSRVIENVGWVLSLLVLVMIFSS